MYAPSHSLASHAAHTLQFYQPDLQALFAVTYSLQIVQPEFDIWRFIVAYVHELLTLYL